MINTKIFKKDAYTVYPFLFKKKSIKTQCYVKTSSQSSNRKIKCFFSFSVSF